MAATCWYRPLLYVVEPLCDVGAGSGSGCMMSQHKQPECLGKIKLSCCSATLLYHLTFDLVENQHEPK